jgi:membrane protein YqaA with SNARE-associated domain
MYDSESPIVEAVIPRSVKPSQKTWQLIRRIAAVVVAVGITLGIILLRDQVERFAVYGYPGIFLISLMGNATLILPVPSFAVVFAVGGALNPLVVGIVAGLGAALGETTGYLAGIAGRSVIENRAFYNRLAEWMCKGGVLVVFLLGAIPNPAFDLGGMVAGTLRMPIWHFVLAGWAGKSVRFTLLALSGQLLLGGLTFPLASAIL